MFELVENRNAKGRELRLSVVDSILELIKDDDKVMALEADLGGASYFKKIENQSPRNFIQMGIQEANMMGVAAGLSIVGYKPFVHTFAPFATRRVLDQIYLAGGYSKNTINIYGSDPGYCVGTNGGTHTAFEDVAILRAIPDIVICDGADDTQVAWIIKEFAKMDGVHYLRSNRKAVFDIYKPGSTFEIGKGNLLSSGEDVLIVAAGEIVKDALDAKDFLQEKGYSVGVIDMFTIKPLDENLLVEQVKKAKIVVTFENHSIIGGLGSAVGEVIVENRLNPIFKRIGVDDRFGQVGSPEFLKEEYGLTSDHLIEEIEALLQEQAK